MCVVVIPAAIIERAMNAVIFVSSGVLYNQAIIGASIMNAIVRDALIPVLSQNKVLINLWLILSFWIMASEKPLTPKFCRSKLKAVTIAIKPKSEGVSSRAKMTVLKRWIKNDNPLAKIVTPAPRMAFPFNPTFKWSVLKKSSLFLC